MLSQIDRSSTKTGSAKAIKILIPLPNLNGGGIEQAVFSLCQNLDRDRFQPSLLVHETVNHGQVALGMNRSVHLPVHLPIHIVHHRPYRRRDLLGLFWATLQQARSADVILAANEGRAAFLALIAAKLWRKPIVMWIHFDWAEFRQITSWRQMLSLKLYGLADRVVACSHGARASFLKLVPIHPDKVQTIYNGIQVETIQQKALEPLPQEWAALFQQPTIVTVGRLDYQKGHDCLIAAHALLRQRGMTQHLVIVGKGELLETLQQQAIELGVADSVHFVGFQANPYRWMKRATVFALSSRFEGFAIVIAEALACGVPVVATDCPSGPAEILSVGNCGILVQPNHASALADGLARMLTEFSATDLTQRQQQAARSIDRGQAFDQRHMGSQWEALLTTL